MKVPKTYRRGGLEGLNFESQHVLFGGQKFGKTYLSSQLEKHSLDLIQALRVTIRSQSDMLGKDPQDTSKRMFFVEMSRTEDISGLIGKLLDIAHDAEHHRFIVRWNAPRSNTVSQKFTIEGTFYDLVKEAFDDMYTFLDVFQHDRTVGEQGKSNPLFF